MSMHRPWSTSPRTLIRIAYLFAFVCAIAAWGRAEAQTVFRNGFEGTAVSDLAPPPDVIVLRDDRVATLEMDYDGENAWGQWWEMSGTGTRTAVHYLGSDGFVISGRGSDSGDMTITMLAHSFKAFSNASPIKSPGEI